MWSVTYQEIILCYMCNTYTSTSIFRCHICSSLKIESSSPHPTYQNPVVPLFTPVSCDDGHTVDSGWNWNYVTLIPLLYNCLQAFTIIHSQSDHSYMDLKHFVVTGSLLPTLFSPQQLCCMFQTDLTCLWYVGWCHHHAAEGCDQKALSDQMGWSIWLKLHPHQLQADILVQLYSYWVMSGLSYYNCVCSAGVT